MMASMKSAACSKMQAQQAPASFGQRIMPMQSPRLQKCGTRPCTMHLRVMATVNGSPDVEEAWKQHGLLAEYAKASNPELPQVPIAVWPGRLHDEGPTRVIPMDLSKYLGTEYHCVAPNMYAAFLRIKAGDHLETSCEATSQVFYVIRGQGHTNCEHGPIHWGKGDVFTLPCTHQQVQHMTDPNSENGAALFWVNDEPLLKYLGVTATEQRFEPALYKHEDLVETVNQYRQSPEAQDKNRIGALLVNQASRDSTQTLTHTLWLLYNVLPANSRQKPHRHAATALDMAIEAPEGTFTEMGLDLDEEGNIIDPVRVPWSTGGMFTTPPGWWHSHVNESDQDAWVMPVQDAALFTYQRVLDIRFVPAELDYMRKKILRGTSERGEEAVLLEHHDM